MKRWSRPRSDAGMTVLNYNRPKVKETSSSRGRSAAPPSGDAGECSWLFAGKPGVSVSTRRESDSDNLMACGVTRATPENQQERPKVIRNPQRPYASHLALLGEMKRWSGPCGDVGRSAEMTDPPVEHRALDWSISNSFQSEIPCRVDDCPSRERSLEQHRLITGNPEP